MGRLVVVSNRIAPPEEVLQAGGGLATGIIGALRSTVGLWCGWSGKAATDTSTGVRLVESAGLTYATVDLRREEIRGHISSAVDEKK